MCVNFWIGKDCQREDTGKRQGAAKPKRTKSKGIQRNTGTWTTFKVKKRLHEQNMLWVEYLEEGLGSDKIVIFFKTSEALEKVLDWETNKRRLKLRSDKVSDLTNWN